MRKYTFVLAVLLLAGCSSDEHIDTVTGKIMKIDESEEMVWVGTSPLYVDSTEEFELGDLVKISFTDPTLTEEWDPSQYEVTKIEYLPDNLYADLREIAWEYLPQEIKDEVTTAKTGAQISTGVSNSSDPFVTLDSPEADKRSVWEVAYESRGKEQPYKVLIDRESLEVIGWRRPEN